MRSLLTKIILGVLLVLPGLAATASAGDPRHDYRLAMAALKAGHLERYQSLRRQLDGYILRPYLDYAYYRDRVDQTPPAKLRKLISEYRDAPVSQWLRIRWLTALADRHDRDGFLAAYEPVPRHNELDCHQIGYRIEAGADWKALEARLDELWRYGRKRPANCEKLFRAWRDAGGLKRDRVWARIGLAMDRAQLSLAEDIARHYLEREDRVWVKRWVAMHRNPKQELEHIGYPLKRPVARMVVIHGINRLARDDPQQAMQTWQRLSGRPEITEADRQQVLHDLGLRAAWKRLAVAADWLAAVSHRTDDSEFSFWRLHSALQLGRWQQARRFLDDLTLDQQGENHWRYFRARILEQTGEPVKARALYARLSTERDYYGFLAADRSGLDYQYRNRDLVASKEEIAEMSARPALRMAREFFELGELAAARRQWAWAIRDMTDRELEIAALVAHRWGWHDRAIMTVGRSGHYDDLDLRFPLAYEGLVRRSAKTAGIDPTWVYGVLRQESAFITDARSSAGALGLMQLMPRTGRQVARQLKLKLRSNWAILNVENNLLLGASYLGSVLEDYGGNQALATAAYNAGPHRVSRWLPEQGTQDADLWVESIPFDETRRYVKNVLSYATVYGHRLDYPEQRMSERMRVVASRDRDR
jgi:soluble lytic murein transglycosylase